MSRPTWIEQEILDCAEGISAKLAHVASLALVLDVRLRQVQRRADVRLLDVLSPAIEQLKQLAGEVHVARGLAFEQLEWLQKQRVQANRGGRDDDEIPFYP